MRKLLLLILLILSAPISKTVAQYPFIRTDINQIVLPADSLIWFDFISKINAAHDSNKGSLNILHFGDSHIQGDYFTGKVRENLFNYVKNSPQSRGITFPYYLAGTNGSEGVKSTSKGFVEKSSIRKNKNKFFFLTGYCISFSDSNCSVIIKDTTKYSYTKAIVLHNPLKGQHFILNGSELSEKINLNDSLQASEFIFNDPQSLLHLKIFNSSKSRKTNIYGFYLSNNNNNVIYNNVGINGATYGTFLQMQDPMSFSKLFKPDCVIFSYGTNDALNKYVDTALFREQIVKSIQIVRKEFPSVPIILITPGDYLIGRKYNNPRTARVTRIIKEVALSNNCAYWDFYSIMGGEGSSKEWYRNSLMFKDYIHLSKKGYRLQGDLFFSAIMKLSDIKH
jgi:lysophospholipase L1-like esterase